MCDMRLCARVCMWGTVLHTVLIILITLILSIQPEHTTNTTATSNTQVVSHDRYVHICQA